MKTTIAIIGGGGFLGSYVTQKFQAQKYPVRASTRSKAHPSGYQHLLDIEPSTAIWEMDVLDQAAVGRFVQGSQIVVHCGTPFTFAVQDAVSEMIRPTVEGTRNVVKACKESGSVKKLILISSVAAINGFVPFFDPDKGREHVFTLADEAVSLPGQPPITRLNTRPINGCNPLLPPIGTSF